MKYIVNFLILSAFVQTFCEGATFERTYGGYYSDEAYSVQQTKDSMYIIAGTTCSYGVGGDVWLIKINSSGNKIWSKTYGGSDYDEGYSVQQTKDSGYVVAGGLSVTTMYECVYIIKTNTLGDTLWTKAYAGDGDSYEHPILQTKDGGYILTANIRNGATDIWLLKIDSLGDTLWTKTYGEGSDDEATCIQMTPDNGYIIVGSTSSYGAGSWDVWLIKIDSLGDTLWTKTYGGIDAEFGSSIQQTVDGGYIIVGLTGSYAVGDWDVWLIKIDSLGDTLWTKTYGGIGRERGKCVQQTNDSGYIIVGTTDSYGHGKDDVYLIKTNSSGDTLWTRTFGGTEHDWGRSVQQTFDGGFIIAGLTCSYGAGQSDVYVIKTDSLGNVYGVEENSDTNVFSAVLKISQNPFIKSTTFKYELPMETPVLLNIYDTSGRLIKTLVNEYKQCGNYSINFDAKKMTGGIYFVNLKMDYCEEVKKLIIIN